MTPERARIFIAEDDEGWLRNARIWLEGDGGHTVVLVARNPEEATECVKRLSELSVDVAIIDGNLSPLSQDGSDGKRIIKKMVENGEGLRKLIDVISPKESEKMILAVLYFWLKEKS